MRASDVCHRVEVAWAPFRAAVEARRDLLDEVTSAGWTAKEMLAHVAFWDEAVIPVVATVFRGDELPTGWAFGSGDLGLPEGQWPPADVHNAREAAWARRRSASEVVDRADGAHTQLMAVLRTVTDQEVSDHPGYFGDLGTHYEEHLVELT